MNPFDQHAEITHRALNGLRRTDSDALGIALDGCVLPFVDLQIAFLEGLGELHMQPDVENVCDQYAHLMTCYRHHMAKIGEIAGQVMRVMDGSCVLEIARDIGAAANAADHLTRCTFADLPPGLDLVFEEIRGDPFEKQAAEVLRSLRVEPRTEQVAALFHVLDRRPRGSLIPRWKVVARGDPRGFRGWLRSAVWGCAKDLHRRTCLPLPPLEAADLEVLVAATDETSTRADVEAVTADVDLEDLNTLFAAAGLTPRERDVATPHFHGDRLVTIARQLGIAPPTARVLWYRARKRIAATVAS